MKKIPLAVQFFSVRHEAEKDYEGTIKAIKEIGYDGIDFFGELNYDPNKLKELLDETGLKVAGWHTQLADLSDDKIDKVIEYNKIIGNKYIVVPYLHLPVKEGNVFDEECYNKWIEYAKRINEVSEKLAQHGMQTGYHNHAFEFNYSYNGVTAWDIFMENLNKEVIMQLDTGNAHSGGGDALSVLKKYPGRATTIHLKPYSKSAKFDTMFGAQDSPDNWEEIFAECYANGTEWFIIEYESEKLYTPMDGIKECFRTLNELKGR